MTYFIVEHLTRGCFVESYWDNDKEKFRFAWSCLRTDAKVERFYRKEDAQRVLKAVRGSYLLRIDTSQKGYGYITRVKEFQHEPLR